jgi:hypothetical protein
MITLPNSPSTGTPWLISIHGEDEAISILNSSLAETPWQLLSIGGKYYVEETSRGAYSDDCFGVLARWKAVQTSVNLALEFADCRNQIHCGNPWRVDKGKLEEVVAAEPVIIEVDSNPPHIEEVSIEELVSVAIRLEEVKPCIKDLARRQDVLAHS